MTVNTNHYRQLKALSRLSIGTTCLLTNGPNGTNFGWYLTEGPRIEGGSRLLSI
ncbi:hypothetical protein [Enterococcus faecium]|uniref:hypothetical protein n=1 Tax=Enterococcus faecium TaxID=1352 RepID=UPI0039C5D850